MKKQFQYTTKEAAETIRFLVADLSSHVLCIGHDLTEAARVLNDVQFSSWLSLECGMSKEAAEKCMTASKTKQPSDIEAAAFAILELNRESAA